MSRHCRVLMRTWSLHDTCRSETRGAPERCNHPPLISQGSLPPVLRTCHPHPTHSRYTRACMPAHALSLAQHPSRARRAAGPVWRRALQPRHHPLLPHPLCTQKRMRFCLTRSCPARSRFSSQSLLTLVEVLVRSAGGGNNGHGAGSDQVRRLLANQRRFHPSLHTRSQAGRARARVRATRSVAARVCQCVCDPAAAAQRPRNPTDARARTRSRLRFLAVMPSTGNLFLAELADPCLLSGVSCGTGDLLGVEAVK